MIATWSGHIPLGPVALGYRCGSESWAHGSTWGIRNGPEMRWFTKLSRQ